MNTKELIDGCLQISAGFATLAKAFQEEAPEVEEPKKAPAKAKAKPAKDEQKQYTLEDVRGKLAELARNGHREDVKAIINKRGKALSDIAATEYVVIMEEAEAIGNG